MIVIEHLKMNQLLALNYSLVVDMPLNELTNPMQP